MAQSDITRFLDSVRDKVAQQLGPSFALVNRLCMADMLQAFNQMPAADRTRFSQAAFDGIPAPGCGGNSTLPEARQVGISRIEFAYRVVVDRSVPKVIPLDLYETGQLRDAYDFLNTKAPTRAVWTTVIGSVCEDAALRVKGEEGGIVSVPVISGSDQTYGQAGWQVGIKYGSGQFKNLPQLITKGCKGFLISKLGLNAHGDAGEVAVNGVDVQMHSIEPSFRARDKNLKTEFGPVLEFLDHVMTPDGVLLFHGCLAGLGGGGTDLLIQVSQELRGARSWGLRRSGTSPSEKQRRGDDQCREPGVRDSEYGYNDPSKEYERFFKDGKWDDLKNLPWQSETSPHAKVALNGTIIRELPLDPGAEEQGRGP